MDMSPEDIRSWCNGVVEKAGGDFLTHIARAAFIADLDNMKILRPVLLQLMKKYPQYYSTVR